MKKISVTVATYNRAYLLEKVLNALSKQTLDPSLFEIIVCDSDSKDDTEQIISVFARQNPQISIRHLHAINVLAAKRNLGIKSAINEIVIFFDDDCIPDQKCLKVYFDLFQDDSIDLTRAVYCGEVRFPKEWVIRSNYYRFRDSRHYGSGRRLDLKNIDYRTIVVMNMAFLRSGFLNSVGAVNEAFVGYGCEDQDLGWRLKEHGFKFHICNALITHHEPSGSIGGYEKKLFHTARDGMATLLNLNPDAVIALGRKFMLIDPDFPNLPGSYKFFNKLLRTTLFNKNLASLLSWFMTKTDGVSLFYFPIIYKYILACAYIRGTKARNKKIGVGNDWYS